MIDTSIYAVAFLAFSVSYVALRVFRPAAIKVRLLDTAGALKHHQGDVPLVGGLAILAGYIFALATHADFLAPNIAFVIIGSLLVISGAVDDRFYARAFKHRKTFVGKSDAVFDLVQIVRQQLVSKIPRGTVDRPRVTGLLVKSDA